MKEGWEREARGILAAWNTTRMLPPLHPQPSHIWEGIHKSSNQMWVFVSFPPPPVVIFLQGQVSFKDYCVQSSFRLHYEDREDLDLGELGSSFLSSNPRAVCLEWIALPWLHERLLWERVIWSLLLNLLQRYYQEEFAMSVSSLWKSKEEMSLILYEQNRKIAVILSGQLKAQASGKSDLDKLSVFSP